MKKILLFILVITLSNSLFSQKKIDIEIDEIIWLDAKSDVFNLVGFEWFQQDSIFRRLPLKSEWKTTQAVDDLANETAGGQLIFNTNSGIII